MTRALRAKHGNYWKPDVEKNQWIEFTCDGVATGNTINKLLPANTITAVWDTEDYILTLANVGGAKDGIVRIPLRTDLKSLAMMPDTIFDGNGQIYIKYLFTMTKKGDAKKAPVMLGSSPAYVNYRVNPSTANLDNVVFSIANRGVYTKAAKEDGNVVFSGYKAVKDGVLEVAVRATDAISEPDHQKTNRQFALVANVNGEDIMSDYAYVYTGEILSDYVLGHKRLLKSKAVQEYRKEFIGIEEKHDSAECIELAEPCLYYKESIDLLDYVDVFSSNGVRFSDLAPLGEVIYNFQLAGKDANGKEVLGNNAVYFGKDGYTDQNKFVKLEGSKMSVDPAFGISAVNRTPLVKVVATYKQDGVEYNVAEAYIKVVVTDKKKEVIIPDYNLYHSIMIKHHVDYTFENLTADGSASDKDYKSDSLVVTWDEVNKVILNDSLGLTFAEFQKLYNLDVVKTLKNKKANATAPIWEYVDYAGDYKIKGTEAINESPEDWATVTNVISLLVNNEVKAPSADTVILVYTLRDEADNYLYPQVAIEFSYTVSTPVPHSHTYALPNMKLNPDYILGKVDTLNVNKPAANYKPNFASETEPYAGVRVKGKENNANASALDEHFKNYNSLALKSDDATLTFQIMNYEASEFQFVDEAAAGYSIKNDVDGKYSSITLSKKQIDDIIAGSLEAPVIQYMGNNILGNKADVLLQVTETCTEVEKNNTKTGYYYVEFNSVKVEVNVDPIVLKTLKPNAENHTADSVMIDSIVTVTDGVDELIEFDGKQWNISDYAIEKYKFTGSEVIKVEFLAYTGKKYIDYKYDLEESFGKNLNVESDKNLIIWDNKGTDLQNRKFAEVTIKVTIADSEFTSEPLKVTILTTKESNE